MTPFQALYSQVPPAINYQAAKSEDPMVIQFAKDIIQTMRLPKNNLCKAQERMKVFADRKRTDREFNIGDEVFLKLQPYRQSSVALKKRIGSGIVVQITPPNANDSEAEEPLPYKILERKLIKKGNNPAVMVKVQWEQGIEDEATWEEWNLLKKKFPEI
ncbi:uncharacterized protein LOC141713869 [Apium graveolens]|uniref:uncharacterized protein LOC141713869 n=1 Tax=Apium graveolens TaxID=4045 RepID=UPI003D7970B9